MTNISPLASILNNSNSNNESRFPESQNDIAPQEPSKKLSGPFATPLTHQKQNIYNSNPNQFWKQKPKEIPPPLPFTNVPSISDIQRNTNSTQNTVQLPSKIFYKQPLDDSTAMSDDASSTMSCQLITSSSLLLNREFVREAKHIVEPMKDVSPFNRKGSIGSNKQSSQTQTLNNLEAHNFHVVLKDCSDPSKPPPMETCI